jgi:CRISPR-associated protein Cas1
MPPLYIVEQGVTLKKKGERLIVTKGGEVLVEAPLPKVDQVIVMGNVQVTTQVISALLASHIDLVFLTAGGRYKGRLMGATPGLVRLRQRQYEAAQDQDFALALARNFLLGKLSNQRVLVQRRARLQLSAAHTKAQEELGELLSKLERCGSLDELRGTEGRAAAVYYGAFQEMLRGELPFNGRSYYPPTDPVNALLSFGYTLLLGDMVSAVETVGLDPYLGFLHHAEDGRPSLALDLMEEFRPVIVDSVVIDAVNHRRLTPAHFSEGDGDGPRLSDEGKRRFLEYYARRMESRVLHGPSGQQTTYRRCLQLQARQVARCILSRQADYRPFSLR